MSISCSNTSFASYETGAILLTEHTLVHVIVCERTELGVSLVMLDTDIVPDVFLLRLSDSHPLLVCKTAWRTPEVIGAWYNSPAGGGAKALN